ncbi:MAG: ATP-dependent helicase [Candidatus Eremiobacteraeota bacterium]|nr:ATP-dependent helicase [Candidatus Eremiobacteraeota bacterium]
MDPFPPTEQQARVIAHRGANLLIFAGPGTGKTETLARRFASLVADDGIRASQILVLTFSRRAAEEMRDRILLRLRQRLGSGLAVSELFVKTFHGFCGRLLDGDSATSRHGLLTPVRERLLWRRVIRESTATLRFFAQDVLDSPKFATDCLNVIAQLKGRGVAPARLRTIAAGDKRLQDIAALFAALEKARADLGLRDFRDLVIEAVDALADRDGVSAAWLRKAGFRHVLVDEFQDSDPIDLQLLQRIAAALTPAPSFCFVGDVNQSIYRFRGASPRNVNGARALFQCATLPLRDNRRSAQAILDVANADVTLDAESLTQAADRREPGEVTLERPVTLDDEVRGMCREVARLMTDGTPACDIAVLLRQNYPHRELVTTGLRDAGIPVAPQPSAGFHEDALVDAIITALRLLADETDEGAWRRLLVNPVIGYHAVDVRHAFDAARRHGEGDAHDALRRHPPHGPRPISWFLDSWKRCQESYESGDPLALLQQLVAELDLLRPIREPHTVPGFDRLASPLRLQALLAAAQDYADTMPGSTSAAALSRVGDFITHLDETVSLLADSLEPPPGVASGVRVMSIHAAKGLEFSAVLIPQLVEGILPAGDRPNRLLGASSLQKLRAADVQIFADGDDALREEHSLWYVALTRAKSSVYVSAPLVDDDGIELQLSSFAEALALRPRTMQPLPADGAAVPGGEQMTLAFENGSGATDERIRLELATLSPSRISDFITCPRRFFYAHVLKLARDEDDATRHGRLLHEVLRRFHVCETDFSAVTDVATAAARYRSVLQALIDELIRQDAALATDSALLYYERQNLETRLGMYAAKLAEEACARPFQVLACEHPVSTALDGLTVRGQADRIDRLLGGGLVIRDYKAGSRKAQLVGAVRRALEMLTEGEAVFGDPPAGLNIQTLLYVDGVEREFGDRVRRLEYWYFRGKGGSANDLLVDLASVGDQADGQTLSREEIARVGRELAVAIARRCTDGRLAAFATTKDEVACTYCSYTDICPGAGVLN